MTRYILDLGVFRSYYAFCARAVPHSLSPGEINFQTDFLGRLCQLLQNVLDVLRVCDNKDTVVSEEVG